MSLTRDWLEGSLRALVPAERLPFKGDSLGLSGMTLNPLIAPQGGSAPIQWRVEGRPGNLSLVLEEHGQVLEMPLRDVEEASFVYFDTDMQAHGQWPPALGVQDALPAATALHLRFADGSQRLWAAPVVGIRNPVPEVFEFDQD